MSYGLALTVVIDEAQLPEFVHKLTIFCKRNSKYQAIKIPLDDIPTSWY
jgi:hypothetical protein